MSKLVSKVVKSPKRAAKKLLRKSKKEGGADMEFDGNLSGSSLGSLGSLGSNKDSANFEYSSSFRKPPSKLPFDDEEDPYLSEGGGRARSKRNVSLNEGEKKPKGNEEGTHQGGYSSDGAISNKKRELRSKNPGRTKRGTSPKRRLQSEAPLSPKQRSQSPKPNRHKSLPSPKSPEGTAKQRSQSPNPKKRSQSPNPKQRPNKNLSEIVKPGRRLKSANSFDDCSETSSLTSPSLTSPSGRKKKKKGLGSSLASLDGSDHSKRSTRSLKKKSSGEIDESDHSKKSIKSRKKEENGYSSDHSRKSVKRSNRRKKSDLDGSEHSTSSNKSKKKNKDDRRGGKKVGAKPRRFNSTGGLADKKKDLRDIKSSHESSLSEEMRAMLADEDAFSGSFVKNDADAKEDDPKSPPQRPSRMSAAFNDMWQTKDAFDNIEEKAASLKKEETAMDRRLAEIEKLEVELAQKTKELEAEKEDLGFQKESMEIQLEEERQKNDALRRIVDSFETMDTTGEVDRVIKEDLRRQVDMLLEENDMLKAKMRTMELEHERTLDNMKAMALQNEQPAKGGRGDVELLAEVAKLRREKEEWTNSNGAEKKDLHEKLQSKDETIQFLMNELQKLKTSRGAGDGEMTLNDGGGGGGGGWLGSVFTMSPGTLKKRVQETSDLPAIP